MASFKVKFRAPAAAGSAGTIYYQIVHERKVRHLDTDYKVMADEWNEKRSAIVMTGRNDRMFYLLSVREGVRIDIERLSALDRKLYAERRVYTVDNLLDEFSRYRREGSLFNFMENIIGRLHQNGKFRTSETYRSTINSFKRFRKCQDIMLETLDSETVEAYEAWLKERGVVPNTISFYMRILRAVYNRAVDQEIIANRNPFRHVYTGIDKTVKRALPLSLIKKLKVLDLSASRSLDYARDMFLLSFCLRGMSFIDMAFLKKSDLKNGYLTYRRRKTGQLLIIEWTGEMQAILDKYPENPNSYLLPIIKDTVSNERNAYRRVSYNINYNLKKIASMAGITVPLTLYVARHSWASAAKSKGVPVSVISEGMGHDSESTTQIYLASFDTSEVDKANSLILSSL